MGKRKIIREMKGSQEEPRKTKMEEMEEKRKEIVDGGEGKEKWRK